MKKMKKKGLRYARRFNPKGQGTLTINLASRMRRVPPQLAPSVLQAARAGQFRGLLGQSWGYSAPIGRPSIVTPFGSSSRPVIITGRA